MRSSFPMDASMVGAVLALSLALLAALSVSGPAAAQEYKVIAANLYGEGYTGGGAAKDGGGDFDGEIDFPAGRLCYYLDLYEIGTPTEAHIHKGEERDDSGPLVLTLTLPAEPGDEACTDAAADVLQAIAAQPAEHYLDIHTADFSEPAVRGQLRE